MLLLAGDPGGVKGAGVVGAAPGAEGKAGTVGREGELSRDTLAEWISCSWSSGGLDERDRFSRHSVSGGDVGVARDPRPDDALRMPFAGFGAAVTVMVDPVAALSWLAVIGIAVDSLRYRQGKRKVVKPLSMTNG